MDKKNKTGRPAIEKLKRLDKRIGFAVTADEYNFLKEKAQKAGFKIGIFAREMTLNGKVVERLSDEQLAILAETNKVINNLNQLTKAFNYFVKEGRIMDLEKRKNEIDTLIENLDKIQKKYGSK